LAVLVAALIAGQAPQQSLSRFEADASLRDIVVDSGAGVAYIAAFDRNEVWKVDLASGDMIATASVGDGPAALALSQDRATLLCVNRDSSTASVIKTDSMRVLGEAKCAEGAIAATALPGGGFAVANGFADSLTLVDPDRPKRSTILDGVQSVPNGLACSDNYLAVTTRVPPALLLYTGGATTPEKTIPLSGTPVSIAASDQAFIVAMESGVVMIAPDGESEFLPISGAVYDVASNGDHIYVLTPSTVSVYARDLTPITSVAATPDSRAIAALPGGGFALASPKDRAWYRSNLPNDPTDQTSGEPVMAEVPDADVDLYRQPIQESEPEAALSVATLDAAIVREQPKETTTPIERDLMEPFIVAQAEPAPTPEPDPPAEPEKKPTPRRPPASPLDAPSPPSLLDGATEDIQSSSEGFQQPDWSQPIRNLKGEPLQYLDNGTKVVGKGGVSFEIDNMKVKADELYFDDTTGEMHLQGNVQATQGESVATADVMHYQLPPSEEKVYPPLVSSSAYMEEDLTDALLRLGSLDATNIVIIEPHRKLQAQQLTYDFETQTGVATNVEGESGQLRFGGQKLTLNPDGTAEGLDLWLTTCDCEHEYYKIRVNQVNMRQDSAYLGKGAQLQLGKVKTPLYWPRWRMSGGDKATIGVDFDSGRSAELGYYLNVGQQFAITPDVDFGLRLWPTTKEGIGLGFDGNYDFMTAPYSRFYRSKGEFHAVGTTKDRGYYEWFHRHEITNNTILLANFEQWSDKDFYKDFYYNRFKNRSEPRNFVNITHTEENVIVTATVSKNTHDFVAETEKLPEVTAHVLERKIADGLYFTFDTINGYYEREPGSGEDRAARTVNVARLTYDVEIGQALNLTPFVEAEMTAYSETRDSGGSDARFSVNTGITAQTRLHKNYNGRWGFESFRHIVLPSFTYSYRDEPGMDVLDSPRLDAYDNVYGRSRLEGKIDNILLGRDAETQLVWPVARLSLYHGNDFWNELRDSEDYEVEIDIRPRPHWGVNAIAERHTIREDASLDDPFFLQAAALEIYQRISGDQADPEALRRYNAQYADYDRVIAMLYYDETLNDGNLSGKLGFAYTKTLDEVFNREILYGLGYKFNEKWSMSFEHRYDFERNELARQEYEIRRALECVEAAVQARQREQGWDLGLELSITAFPGTSLKF
jgi:lipopolysaccharide assembly outer membrane protein LptD (OstA)